MTAFANPATFPIIPFPSLPPQMQFYIAISRSLFLPVCMKKPKTILETVNTGATQHTSSTKKCHMKWQFFNPAAKPKLFKAALSDE